MEEGTQLSQPGTPENGWPKGSHPWMKGHNFLGKVPEGLSGPVQAYAGWQTLWRSIVE